MNTETENNNEADKALQGAFGDRGTNVNAIAYGHPYADKIIEGAKEVLRESETGRILIDVQEKLNIPVHVMKGKSESGFSPEMNTVFLYVPGKITKASGETVFDYIKAAREADLDYAGHKAPDPMKDLMEYAGFMHARNLDTITHVCKIVKELTNSSDSSVLLDTLRNLGFNDFYRAYLNGASRDELYDHYAEADDNRGSI